ncbi:MAG: hypothetical protein JWO58_2368 [Chitinophagaceae bacterium]|nr:hypothetical protein [Chitinophagaceae bacterium]
MTLNDTEIIIKKVAIGILIYLIPVILIVGGLWLTTIVLKKDKSIQPTSYSVQP